MRTNRLLAIGVAAVVAATIPVASSLTADASSGSITGSISTATPAAHVPVPKVRVSGAVTTTMSFTVDQLAALPQQTQTDTYLSGASSETHTFTGPRLLDVLNLAVPTFDPAIKNDKLRYVVLATASDNYKSTVAWAEIDPDFGNTQDLLAISQDGVALTQPRLTVPSDARGGRYVSNVITLRVVQVGS